MLMQGSAYFEVRQTMEESRSMRIVWRPSKLALQVVGISTIALSTQCCAASAARGMWRPSKLALLDGGEQ